VWCPFRSFCILYSRLVLNLFCCSLGF
jgi:hypothetical protein